MVALGSRLCYSGGITRCTMTHGILLDSKRPGLGSIVTSKWAPNKIVSPWCHLTGISECPFTSPVTARWPPQTSWRDALVVKDLASEGSEARSDRVWSTNALGRRLGYSAPRAESQTNVVRLRGGNREACSEAYRCGTACSSLWDNDLFPNGREGVLGDMGYQSA